MKTQAPQTFTEQVMEIFEKNPSTAYRSNKISELLQENADRVAQALCRLHEQGRLVRCKVTVPADERKHKAPAEQYEYKLPAGLTALAAAKPYKAPKAYRRDTDVRATPAAGGANISGSHARDSVVDGGPRTDPPSRGVAVVEQPKPDDLPVEACSDELLDWRHKAAYYGINSPNALDHYCANANNKLAQAEKQRDEHFATADDLRNQLALAENALGEWLRLANMYGCNGWHQLRNRLETMHTLAENDADEQVDVTEAAIGYLVRAPKRKPRLCGKHESAIAAAKAAAKAAGRADVLALVPVGIARARKATTVEFTEAA